MKDVYRIYICCLLSVFLGFILSPHTLQPVFGLERISISLFDTFIIGTLHFIVFLVSGLSIKPTQSRRIDDLFSFGIISGIAHLTSVMVYMLSLNRGYGRYIVFISWLTLNILHYLVYRLEEMKREDEPLIVYGNLEAGDRENMVQLFTKIFVVDANLKDNEIFEYVVEIKRSFQKIRIVDFAGDLYERYDLVLSLNMQSNIEVFDKHDLWEKFYGMVHIDSDDGKWLYQAVQRRKSCMNLKRFFDVIVALVGLTITFPLLLVIYIFQRFLDQGPFLYSQTRLGLSGKQFRIYKIRTMRLDAEVGGAMWARVKDDRVTKFGAVLRRTRIDEIPQFYNILKGEMSFIGPRPERPEFAKSIENRSKRFALRCLYKPGLTGWAQVNFRYGSSIDDSLRKLGYDLYYIKNWSFVLDVNILFRTVLAMVKGAR
jgi:lipopolysaccharide/colanic/teichoic acid biosynthesis glycosyltransferase